MGCVQSLPFASLLSSKVGGQTQSRIVHSSARMEADSKTVPSIVVYVTVPNKEAEKHTVPRRSKNLGLGWLESCCGKTRTRVQVIIIKGSILNSCIYLVNRRDCGMCFSHTLNDEIDVYLIGDVCVLVIINSGKKLAESIVKERLAACVNQVPGVESVYEWKGEIQTDSEELLIIKTRESLLEALTEHVEANHEYGLAEVIALPITGGNLQFLEWIKNSTRT